MDALRFVGRGLSRDNKEKLRRHFRPPNNRNNILNLGDGWKWRIDVGWHSLKPLAMGGLHTLKVLEDSGWPTTRRCLRGASEFTPIATKIKFPRSCVPGLRPVFQARIVLLMEY